MEYNIVLKDFEGPLDLLLHLIKQSDINIWDISIELITKQYLDYIKKMEELNLNIASEYLIMAAELIEIKSNTLLPRPKQVEEDEFVEDPKEQLINRLIEYQRYKDMTSEFKNLEEQRKFIFSKEPSDLSEYQNDIKPKLPEDVTISDLMSAFENFLKRKDIEKPLNTKITKKEYSVTARSGEIKKIIKNKKRVEFFELFTTLSRDFIVVTFLSVLDLVKKQEIDVKQDKNFNSIYLLEKGCEQ